MLKYTHMRILYSRQIKKFHLILIISQLILSYEYTSTHIRYMGQFTAVEVCCKKQYVPDVPLLVNLCDFVALCEKIHRKVSGWSHSQVVFVVHCVASERAATNVQGEGHGVIRSNAGDQGRNRSP